MVTWTVDFPNTSGCSWGTDGNLPALDAVLTARTEQFQNYSPPSGSVMCDVRPKIQDNQGGHYQQGFEFDDHVLLTYNDYVLFSSTDEFIPSLPSGSWSGVFYDWSMVQGSYAFNGSVWEWGNTYFDAGSGFELYVANGKMNNVNTLSITNQSMEFMLSVMGDNDTVGTNDGPDCYHTGLSFTVEIDLAQ